MGLMRVTGRIGIAGALAILAAGAAAGCGARCDRIEAARAELGRRAAAVDRAHARIWVPSAHANQLMAEILRDQPAVPLEAPGALGKLGSALGPFEMVPERVTVGPGPPDRIRFDVLVGVRAGGVRLFGLRGEVEAEPRLERDPDGGHRLVIEFSAEDLRSLEADLGDGSTADLAEVLERRLRDAGRRAAQPLARRAARELVERLGDHAYERLHTTLLRRLGELSRVTVALPDLPVARTRLRSVAGPVPGFLIDVLSDLPVRAGLAPALADAGAGEPDALRVWVSASTMAELGNWGIDQGHLPRATAGT